MHTQKSFEYFLKQNADNGLNYKLKNVTSFSERNTTLDEIYVMELPNGVKQLQLPYEAFKKNSLGKNSYGYDDAGNKVRGVKTIMPSSWTDSDVVSATNSILSNPSYLKGSNSYSQKWLGEYNGVKLQIFTDNSSSPKVNSFYPFWRQ